MINANKYRIVIATILFVVYAFIATPVQLWHQHTYVANTECKNAGNKKATTITIKATQQTIVDANCTVCSHFYSAYNSVTNIELETPFFVVQPKNASFILSIPFSPLLNFTNKGPPALTA